MAFDAGAIEATLTLDRNPFTAGLLAAKAQAEKFARSKIEMPIQAKLDRASLAAVKEQINRAVGKISVRVSLDRESLKAVQAQINRSVGRIQVRVSLDRESLTKVKEQIARTVGRIQVKVSLDRASVAKLKAQLASLDTTVHVRAVLDKNSAASVRNIGQSFDEASGSMGRFEKIAVAVVALLPVLASAFTAAGGLIGALGSALVIAGAGAGAFALVAVPAFKKVKDAAAEGQAAVNKLPPGLRAAGNAMIGFNKQLDLLKKNSEGLTGAALASWINAATAGLKTLQPLIDASAKAFAVVGDKAKAFFEGPWWAHFVQFVSSTFQPVLSGLWTIFQSLIQVIGNFTEAIWKAGGDKIWASLVKGMQDFAAWTEKLGQNQTFLAFMDAAKRALPEVGALLREVVEFIIKLAVGLEPLGTIIIRVLTGIFEALNKMPPEWLGAIAIAIGAIWAAIALGAGGPVALAIGVLAGLSTLFGDAYAKSQTLRDGINELIAPIRDWMIPLGQRLADIWNVYVIPAWDNAVKATRENLLPVLDELYRKFVADVLPALERLAITFTQTLLPAILDFWAAIQPFVAWAVKAFGSDIVYAVQLLVATFDGAFQAIAGLLNVFTGIFTGDWTKFTEGIRQITEGFWTVIAGIFGLNLDELKGKMQQWSTEQVFTWQGMWDSIKAGASAFFTWFNDGWIKLWTDSANEGKTWGAIVAASFQNDFLNVIRDAATGFFSWWGNGWLKLWMDSDAEQRDWSGRITSSFQRDFLDVLRNGFTSFSSWFTDGWTRMGTALKNEWNSWAGSLSAAFRTMVDNARTGANAVIDELNRLIGAVNGFLSSLGVGGIPTISHLASGGILGSDAPGGQVTGLASGGRIGGGFMTNGPVAVVGEGNPNYPEYVIPTDPQYRGRARSLYSSLGPQLMASGGILSIPGNLAGGAQAAVDGIINGLTNSAGWKWGEIAVAVAHKAAGALIAKVQSGINAVMAAIAAAAAAAFGGGGGTITGGGDARSWIIAHESGGNPRAQNPTSSASGLYQMIDGTWRAYGGSTAHAKDASVAEQNAVADRYVAARYGSWENAQSFWMAHHYYDKGGWLQPGTTLATNLTGAPEAILTQQQLAALTAPTRRGLSQDDLAVLAALINNSGGGGGGGDVYNVMLPEKASVRELADTLDFKRRVLSKGRYSR